MLEGALQFCYKLEYISRIYSSVKLKVNIIEPADGVGDICNYPEGSRTSSSHKSH